MLIVVAPVTVSRPDTFRNSLPAMVLGVVSVSEPIV